MKTRFLAPLAISGALLSGCASTSPQRPFKELAADVEARSGHKLRWKPGAHEDPAAEKAIDELLARELTADAAVQVALLANPALKARLEQLAIAQADLVQAGLLKNPVFSIGRTAWEEEHIQPNLFATVEQDFLDLLTMPLRKRVAATELEATRLEVGDHVLELGAQVREAFYAAQAAEQAASVRQLVAEAASASAELARRQHAAGNMSDLALNTELGLAAQTMLDRTRAEGEAATHREALNKVMGLWGKRTAWRLPPRLPDPSPQEAPLEHLEGLALRQRLDIASARRNAQAMRYALSLAKTTRWTGTVNVAVEAGRLRHNKRVSFGPSVALEIPLFDQRQAQIARLEAFTRQAENELQALAVDVRANVRAARTRVLTARALVEQYGKVLVPVRENIVRFTQEQYDAMLVGVYQLIQAKQSEFEAYRDYIEALREYWTARSELERAVGTRIGPPPRIAAAPPRAEPAQSHEHHH